MIDIEMHADHAAEARRRIALAAGMDDHASTRSEVDMAAILAGARAVFWLTAGRSKRVSTAFIDDLVRQYGVATVMAAAVCLCRFQPAGPCAWMRQACKQRPSTPAVR